jgi:hypothetical protein
MAGMRPAWTGTRRSGNADCEKAAGRTDEAMTDPHTEMHDTYARANSAWPDTSAVITEDDFRGGKIAEVIRWCRDRLGGRDRDLVPPERWEAASREGWSIRATYGPFFFPKSGQTWHGYIHDVAHTVYLMLPLARDGSRNYDGHSVQHSHIELELTQHVVGLARR